MSEEITTIDDHLDTLGTAGNLASKITTMSEEITTIDDNIDRIRVLGDYNGSDSPLAQGFKVRDDSTLTGKIAVATLYKLYIEDGEILSSGSTVSPEEQQAAIIKVRSLYNSASTEL